MFSITKEAQLRALCFTLVFDYQYSVAVSANIGIRTNPSPTVDEADDNFHL